MTEHTDTNEPTKFPALIERTTCDCEWHVDGVLAVRCLQCDTVERIAAWLDDMAIARGSYSEGSDLMKWTARAIRRGDWKGKA